MNKAFLVAQREYMENARTKGFWIGILLMPVFLVVGFGAPVLLDKQKDTRHYAVLDPTGEFLQAVEERANLPDLEKVITDSYSLYVSREKDEGAKESFEKLPEYLRTLVEKLAEEIETRKEGIGSDDLAEQRKVEEETIKQFSGLLSTVAKPEGFALYSAHAGGSTWEDFNEKALEPVRKWWRALPPDEAKKYGSSLSKSRYHRVSDIDLTGSDPEGKLRELVANGKLFAYFVLPADPVSGSEGFKYVSNNLTDSDLKDWFTRYASAEVRERLVEKAGIQEEVAKRIQKPIEFESKQLSDTGEEADVKKEDVMKDVAPVAFVYLLWLAVFMIAQSLMTNTIEEKSIKIMEVLLSSISPIQLMAGKIIGIAGTGLTMIGAWIICFLIALKTLPQLFGAGPDLDFSLIIREPVYLTSFVAYFILGYLLLSAILVGIGSVCNSLKEAQSLMMPVTLILIVPLVAMIPIMKDPNGMIAKVLSYIPPFTPFVMMNRAGLPPTAMEYVITTILLIVSIVVALWAAAKVFRVGILMTGKPPRPAEIWRWIRAPVGQVHEEKRD